MDIRQFLFLTNRPIQLSCHCFFNATWLRAHMFYLWLNSATCGSQLPFHQYNLTYITVRTGGRRVWIVDWQGKNPVPLRVRQSQTAYGMCRVYNESTCGGNSAHGTDTAMLNKREEELLDLAYIEEYCSEFIFHKSSEQSWAWERALSETDACEGRMDGTTIVARLYSVSDG